MEPGRHSSGVQCHPKAGYRLRLSIVVHSSSVRGLIGNEVLAVKLAEAAIRQFRPSARS